MRIYPAIHYTMGGLWVDYNLMSTIPGLFVIGEANFSDHGANRLGASALMQGLSDGYFIVPYTVGDYLATNKLPKIDADDPEIRNAVACVQQTIQKLLSINGKRTVDSFHRQLGKIVWDYCGMSRNAEGLESAIQQIRELREEFWQNVKVIGEAEDMNQSLEKAGRVADFFELAELMCIDARERNESAVGTSARSIRQQKAKRSATTRITRTSPLGIIAATETIRSSSRNRSNSSTCIRAKGVTSSASHAEGLASEKPDSSR